MNEDKRDVTSTSPVLYRFGQFTLAVASGTLTRNGIRVRLQDQPFQLLALLLERAGDVVSREEIRQRLWQGNTFVDFDKSLGVAVLKVRDALGDNAANPRFLETVHRRGYRFIAPVVAESLPQSANLPIQSEPVAMPTGVRSAPGQSDTAPGSAAVQRGLPLQRLSWYLAGTLAAVLLFAFMAYRVRPRSSPSLPSQQVSSFQPKIRRSVAVLGFRNVAGGPDKQWLSTAFTEMLNTELAANGDLRMVSEEDVTNVKHDLSVPADATLAKTTLQRLRSSLDADVVVAGSFTLLTQDAKSRIRLDIRAQDTALGETVFEDSLTGNENDLFDLVSQAGSRLRESLDPSLGLAPADAQPPTSESSNQVALQFYSEGLSRLYEFDFVGARDFLTRAVSADPSFALAHSALSRALNGLGYADASRDEAKLAWEHAKGLPEETALSIQGQFQESASDWQNAVVTRRKLFQLFPDNLAYGLQLATAQLHIDPSGCLSTLATLRALPAPLGNDPRIDLMEASALINHDLPKARTFAQTAIDKASKRGSTLMVARGFGILCQLSTAVGVSMEQSVSECTLARNSYVSAGDQNNAARTLNDLAILYDQRGDLEKAEAMWTEAIKVFRKVGDTQGLAASSNNVGDVLLTRGKLDEAETLLREALAGYRLIGDRSGEALDLVDLGDIALKHGDLATAQRNDEQAIAIGSQFDDKSSTAYGMAALGDVLMARDQLTAARKQYQQAFNIRQGLGEAETILQTRVDLARLSIEEGHAEAAEPEARQTIDQFHQQQLLDDELSAGLVLADALLHQEKNVEARKEIAVLRALEQKTQNRFLQLSFSLESAKVLLADHDLRSAQAVLRSVLKEAEASKFVVVAMEAQGLLARAQTENGDPAASKGLKMVDFKERSSGFLLLARKAGERTKTNVASAK